MPGKFGTAENNNVMTVQQAYAAALSSGYMAQLQAYGVGKGLTQQEAEKRAIENMGINIHPQQIETFRDIQKNIDSARKEHEKQAFLNYQQEAENNAVSTGANNVKEVAPAPVTTGVGQKE